MEMKITFGSGKKVTAEYNGNLIQTDQPVRNGGEGSSPSPFDLFLASIGTCAGIYVKSFCMQREIPTENITLTQIMEVDPQTRLISDINIQIDLPDDFPEKYKEALINSAELCTVKKHLQNPPHIKVTTKI
jgi:ribosomal protein S12 methylthiotransferase accessory factor